MKLFSKEQTIAKDLTNTQSGMLEVVHSQLEGSPLRTIKGVDDYVEATVEQSEDSKDALNKMEELLELASIMEQKAKEIKKHVNKGLDYIKKNPQDFD